VSIEIKEVVSVAHIHADVISLKNINAARLRELHIEHPDVSLVEGVNTVGWYPRGYGSANFTVWSEDFGYVKVSIEPQNSQQQSDMGKVVATLQKVFN
jgi:hypothetical protein